MSAGGGQGPLRGAYFPLTFATQTLSTASSGAGYLLGTWTVPTGSRFGIVNVQADCEFSGSNGQAVAVGRVNVLANGVSVLSSEISLATNSSTTGTLTAGTVWVESGQNITATGAGGFGAGGASSNPTHVSVRVMGFVSKHPNSIFGNFGYADATTQPTTGP